MQNKRLQQYFQLNYHWYEAVTPEHPSSIFYAEKSLREYLEQPLTATMAKEIMDKFADLFAIRLGDNGFAKAAERDVEEDASNYDAVWVRDAVWIYFYLAAFAPEQASLLIDKLYTYYQSEAQQARFDDIIDNPNLAVDAMAVPHIRFDGNSKDYADVTIDGKTQVWNHRQMDAHGLFLLALAHAVENESIAIEKSSLVLLLNRFSDFFAAIDFSNYEDAGAWEEIERVNTSSVALVTNALGRWQSLSRKLNIEITGDMSVLIEQGFKRVKKQLAVGGESPDYAADDLHYRLDDAALLHVMVPCFLQGLDYEDYERLLNSVEKLIRPHGVIRYQNDSYQCANFWLVSESQVASLTDDSSDETAFVQRGEKMVKNSEAEWFFDSMIAQSKLALCRYFPERCDQERRLQESAWHIKRALAQITADNMLSADGNPVGSRRLPESINSVIIENRRYYLPSPITPLNWARASLALALRDYIDMASAFSAQKMKKHDKNDELNAHQRDIDRHKTI
ncbi:MAG: hypothetical protein ACO2ZM_02230 [Francisellaceae bacterium]